MPCGRQRAFGECREASVVGEWDGACSLLGEGGRGWRGQWRLDHKGPMLYSRSLAKAVLGKGETGNEGSSREASGRLRADGSFHQEAVGEAEIKECFQELSEVGEN